MCVLTLITLRNGSPIDARLAYFTQSAPQNSVAFRGAGGVVVDDDLGLVASHLNELPVACNVSDFLVESHSALLGSFQVARSAQLQIGLGNAETVVGFAHDIDTLAGIGRQLETGDEDAVRLVGTTTNTSSELVELGEPETLGVEDDHHGGVRHVDPHLNHSGSNENLRLATDKLLHLGLLISRFHLAVYLAQAKFWENLF